MVWIPILRRTSASHTELKEEAKEGLREEAKERLERKPRKS